MEKSKNVAFLVVAVEALIIIVLGAFLVQASVGGGLGIPADKAGQLAIDYINKNFPSSDGTAGASLVKSEAANGVYKLTIKFGGNEYTSYITKDGTIFFTEGISIKPAETKKFTKTDKPEVDLFVMSFCPYGNQAETTMAPVIDLLKDKMNAKLHYIFYSNYGDPAQASQYCYDKERKYCSMHGIQELNQGVRELCVQKYQPEKLWGFVKAINDGATAQDVDSKWESIATASGVDVAKVKDCYKNEATDILKAEVELTGAKYPVSDPAQHQGATEATIAGSPTFVINGMLYDGSRTSEDVKVAVCSAFNTQPTECQKTLTEATTTTSAGSCN